MQLRGARQRAHILPSPPPPPQFPVPMPPPELRGFVCLVCARGAEGRGGRRRGPRGALASQRVQLGALLLGDVVQAWPHGFERSSSAQCAGGEGSSDCADEACGDEASTQVGLGRGRTAMRHELEPAAQRLVVHRWQHLRDRAHAWPRVRMRLCATSARPLPPASPSLLNREDANDNAFRQTHCNGLPLCPHYPAPR